MNAMTRSLLSTAPGRELPLRSALGSLIAPNTARGGVPGKIVCQVTSLFGDPPLLLILRATLEQARILVDVAVTGRRGPARLAGRQVGACVLAAPAVILFIAFQKHFTASDIGSGVKG